MSLMRRRGLSTWNPFQELEEMMERMGSRAPTRRGEGSQESLAMSDWTPSVNIREDEGAYLIEAELPSVNKDDVHVSVQDGVLTIEGERQLKKEEGKEGTRYHRVETAYGSFMRRFTLPEDADDEQVSASFEDGMLEVSIPKAKRERSRARRVEVR